MDPLTQGLLGATAAQNGGSGRRHTVAVSLLGFLAGMAADLDVVIRSPTDPLLFLEYHRQFTHSLVFIPIGGALCGLVLYLLFARRQLSLWQSVFYCTLGYATHALLDACTTYGTQLLWPFSDARIAWNVLSIIDPLYTLPLLAACLIAAKGRTWAARFALFWVLAYPAMGWWQHQRAEGAAQQLARERGHDVISLDVKPSFANIVVWKSVYSSGGRYYVDAVRAGRRVTVIPGSSIPQLNLQRDLPWLTPSATQAEDVERFRHFSNGYIALDPEVPNRIIDIRYSLLPHEIDALWSIQLDPQAPEQHVSFQSHRQDSRAKSKTLWHMLRGSPLPSLNSKQIADSQL